MKHYFKGLLAAAIGLLAVILMINAGINFNRTAAIHRQNELLEQRIVELKAQNGLLRENKMCLAAKSAADLADPICGPNPDAFRSPSPTPHQEGDHGPQP